MKKSVVEAKINKFKEQMDNFADDTQAKLAKTKFRESVDEMMVNDNQENFDRKGIDRNID